MALLKHPLPYLWSKTVTLDNSSTYTELGSTYLSGMLQHIYIEISKAATTNHYVLVTTSSTSRSLFKLVDPSTIGVYYRIRPFEYGTTGNILATYTGNHVLCDERIRVHVASSSDYKDETVTVQLIMS